MKLLESIGFYIHPDNSIPLLLPQLENSIIGAIAFKIGSLRALQGIINGSEESKVALQIPLIIESLTNVDLMQNESMLILKEVSSCVLSVLRKFNSRSVTDNYGLFMALVNLQSAPGNEKVPGFTELQINTGCSMTILASRFDQSVYAVYMTSVLELFGKSVDTWTSHSVDPRVFETCVLNLGDNFGEFLKECIPIFRSLSKSSYPDLQIRLFSILLQIFSTADFDYKSIDDSDCFMEFALRNNIWKAGEKFTRIRSLATDLFKVLLQNGAFSTTQIRLVFKEAIFPVFLSNLDDDPLQTRRSTLQVFQLLFGADSIWEGTFNVLIV